MSRKNKFHTKFRPHFIAGMLTFLVIAAGTSFAIAFFHRADNTFKTRMILMLAGYGVLTALMLISFFWIYVARKEIETTYSRDEVRVSIEDLGIEEDSEAVLSSKEIKYRRNVIKDREKDIKTTEYNFEQWYKRTYIREYKSIQNEIERLDKSDKDAIAKYQETNALERDLALKENELKRYSEAIGRAKGILNALKDDKTFSGQTITRLNNEIIQNLAVFNDEQRYEKIFSREEEARSKQRISGGPRASLNTVEVRDIFGRKKKTPEKFSITSSRPEPGQDIESLLRSMINMDKDVIQDIVKSVNDLAEEIKNEANKIRDKVNEVLAKCKCKSIQFIRTEDN